MYCGISDSCWQLLNACVRVQDNRSEDDCGSQPEHPNDQQEQQDQQQQEEQQADQRQSGRKRKLSPRAAEAAAAAAAQAAADPDSAEIAAEVHAVPGVSGSAAAAAVAGVLVPRDTAECMSSMRRNIAAGAQKGKSKRQKAGGVNGGEWSGCEGAEASCGHLLADADMLGVHASARAAGMVTRGHRTVFDPSGEPPPPELPAVFQPSRLCCISPESRPAILDQGKEYNLSTLLPVWPLHCCTSVTFDVAIVTWYTETVPSVLAADTQRVASRLPGKYLGQVRFAALTTLSEHQGVDMRAGAVKTTTSDSSKAAAAAAVSAALAAVMQQPPFPEGSFRRRIRGTKAFQPACSAV